ncbi:MAG: hypothetical protein NT069_04305, partial [Planctomycetota bacterium]|nr:hypothetical protein [Planctomycetota bacterium]
NAVTTTTFYAPITTLEWPVDYLSMQGEVELETAAILVDADSRKPAYSKWDAKVTFDGNVQVIDIATSAEILRITAHDGTATAVAIIPDRSRPITAGEDRTVRFYDLVTGREAAVIRIQQGVKNLISSPDGSRFVLRLSDGSAEIWDIRSRKERQTNWALRGAEQKPAREYLASLSTGSTQMGDLKQAVRDEPTLTPLRKLVILEMLDSHASSAERIVRNLKTTNDFNKARIRDSVNQMMLDDRTKIVAQFVLELVDRWEPTANELLGAAWELFLLPDPSPTDYAAALDSAQKAAILEPDDCVIINTLGVAEYRVGLFQNAIRHAGEVRGAVRRGGRNGTVQPDILGDGQVPSGRRRRGPGPA